MFLSVSILAYFFKTDVSSPGLDFKMWQRQGRGQSHEAHTMRTPLQANNRVLITCSCLTNNTSIYPYYDPGTFLHYSTRTSWMTSSNPHLDTNTATSQPPEISQATQPVGNKSRLIWQKCFYCSQNGSYK